MIYSSNWCACSYDCASCPAGNGRYMLQEGAADKVCSCHGAAFADRLRRYKMYIISYMQVWSWLGCSMQVVGSVACMWGACSMQMGFTALRYGGLCGV
jgi:hypothetical protein